MTTQPGLVVAGCGGHAKVLIATIEAAGRRVVRLLDDDQAMHGTTVLGHQVEGPICDEMIPEGACVVLGIGSNSVRREVAARLHAPFARVVHPSAVVHPTVRIGPGTVVFAGAVVQPDCTLGAHVIVNTGSSVDHDCQVGDFAHVGPGARLAGHVCLEAGAFMGIGSCAIPSSRVGAWSVVGAGAAVVGPIASGVVVGGVPARVLRSLR